MTEKKKGKGKARAKLTPLQAKFVIEYARDQNATQAAIRAGYAEDGAGTEGYRLLKNAQIRNAVQREMNRHLADRGVKVRTIINRLDDLAGVDPAEAFDNDGRMLSWADIPLEVRRCIKDVTIREEFDGVGKDRTKVAEITKVTFYDRVKANELLGKHLKMFNEEIDVNHNVKLEDLIAGAGRDVTPRAPQIEPDDDGEDE